MPRTIILDRIILSQELLDYKQIIISQLIDKCSKNNSDNNNNSNSRRNHHHRLLQWTTYPKQAQQQQHQELHHPKMVVIILLKTKRIHHHNILKFQYFFNIKAISLPTLIQILILIKQLVIHPFLQPLQFSFQYHRIHPFLQSETIWI